MSFKFKQSQRFRIIVGDTVYAACFYATAKQMRDGVGDFIKCNQAVREALRSLQDTRSGEGLAEQCATGIAGTWENVPVQITMA